MASLDSAGLFIHFVPAYLCLVELHHVHLNLSILCICYLHVSYLHQEITLVCICRLILKDI